MNAVNDELPAAGKHFHLLLRVAVRRDELPLGMPEWPGRLEKDRAARRAAETNANRAVLPEPFAHELLDGLGSLRVFDVNIQAWLGRAQNAGVGVRIEPGPDLNVVSRRRPTLGPALQLRYL